MTEPTEVFYCQICGAELDPIEEGKETCEHCWYMMRMQPRVWKKELRARGIEVERTEYPIPLEGGGHIDGNPYRKKGSRPMSAEELQSVKDAIKRAMDSFDVEEGQVK